MRPWALTTVLSSCISARLTTAFVLLAALALFGCDLFKDHHLSAEEEVELQLKKMHVAIEEGIGDGSTAKVAVLGVLDSSQISVAGGEHAAEEKKAKGKDKDDKSAHDPAEALLRERKVRDALNASLVRNRLMELLQPAETALAEARADMQASNSAALSVEQCKALGEQLSAAYIAGAIIDEDGKRVSVAVQRSEDGVVVFQDVLMDWPAVVGEATGEEGSVEASKH